MAKPTRSKRPTKYAAGIMAEVSKSDIRKLRAIGGDQAKAVRKCCGGVAREWATRFASAVRSGGGRYGIPGFGPRHPATAIIHGGVWGGGDQNIPPRPGRKSWIAFWMRRGEQHIGFKDNDPCASWFSDKLQTAEHRRLRRGERAWLHRRLGAAYATMSGRLDRPERNVIGPLAAAVSADYGPNLVRRLNKETARLLREHNRAAQ